MALLFLAPPLRAQGIFYTVNTTSETVVVGAAVLGSASASEFTVFPNFWAEEKG